MFSNQRMFLKERGVSFCIRKIIKKIIVLRKEKLIPLSLNGGGKISAEIFILLKQRKKVSDMTPLPTHLINYFPDAFIGEEK